MSLIINNFQAMLVNGTVNDLSHISISNDVPFVTLSFIDNIFNNTIQVMNACKKTIIKTNFEEG